MRDMDKKRKRDRERMQNKYYNPPQDVPPAEFRPMRLLIIDIETMANLSWTWDTWKQDIAPKQIVQHKRTISFAAKWYDQPYAPVSQPEFFSEYHDGRTAMVLQAHRLLSAADAVIGYNSKRFDGRHLNAEFARGGMAPPAPFAHIDLLATVKREFLFGSNKLESVAEHFDLGQKEEHEGFGLWVKTACHDPRIHAFYPDISDADVKDAWERMRTYNVNDVILTEKLYRRILPWITNHPSYAAFSRSEVPMCPNDGSEDLADKGWHYARTRRYARYQCRRCGKWSRARKAEQVTNTTETSSY